MHQIKSANEALTFDELVQKCMDEVVIHPDIYHYLLEHAIRSQTFGYNTQWAKVAEACAKAFVMSYKDTRILTDKFIFSLAIQLAEHSVKEIAHDYQDTLQRVQ